MKKIALLIIVLVPLVIWSCASKRFYKQGQKFDEAGMYTDAAEYYYKSLAKKPKNIDAKIALQRTGQLVLDDKMKKFEDLYQNGDAKDAVYAFRGADAYYRRLSALGVKLILSEVQKTYYNEVEDIYLYKLYREASKALELEEFDKSEEQFNEIITINSNYKDSYSKWVIAKYEPVYREGNLQLEQNLGRSAYLNFNRIVREVGTYKNSIELREKALEIAEVTIVMGPFDATNRVSYQVSLRLKSEIGSEVSGLDSPFYTLIGQESIKSIPNWSKLTNATNAITKAKELDSIFEAKAVLTGKVTKLTKYGGSLKKTSHKGYLRKTYYVTDPETKEEVEKTRYIKITYDVFEQENKVSLGFEYKMSRIDKDEEAFVGSFNKTEKSDVHYAKYDGDHKQVIPGYWKYRNKRSSEDKIYDDKSSVSKLQSLFNANRRIMSLTDLENEIFERCSNEVAEKISNYRPEN